MLQARTFIDEYLAPQLISVFIERIMYLDGDLFHPLRADPHCTNHWFITEAVASCPCGGLWHLGVREKEWLPVTLVTCGWRLQYKVDTSVRGRILSLTDYDMIANAIADYVENL
jgi:hypothetical protein